MSGDKQIFDQACKRCPRLSQFLHDVKAKYPDYHALPVAPFGALDSDLLIVGLAPGMHGANATGRPFTGDYAGVLLYETLYKFGFSNQPLSTSLDDGLVLNNCRISNAVKCLPPENKPNAEEIRACNIFLNHEIASMQPRVILALGKIAHDAVLKACTLKLSQYKFAHRASHSILDKTVLLDSYHCSRYNTQTKRLTEAMFHSVFEDICTIITR